MYGAGAVYSAGAGTVARHGHGGESTTTTRSIGRNRTVQYTAATVLHGKIQGPEAYGTCA
jgi:hypothetical protein